MAAISWTRPLGTLTEAKTPGIAAALTQSAVGDNTVVVDFYVDSTDDDYAADTIICRLQGTISVVGQKLELSLTPYYWDGNDAYTSATNPANGTAVSSGEVKKITLATDLDAFFVTGGFDRS